MIQKPQKQKTPRENARLLTLPYDLIMNISDHITEKINSYIADGTLQHEEHFPFDISSAHYVNGANITDRLLIIIVESFSEDRRIEIEEKYPTLAFIPYPEDFLLDAAGLDTGSFWIDSATGDGQDEVPCYLISLFLNIDIDTKRFFLKKEDVFHLLVHEWTHLVDRPFRKFFEAKTTERYRNKQSEVLAYSQQIINTVRRHKYIYFDLFEKFPNGLVEFLDSYSREWREIEGSLNRKNRNKILSYVYYELYG